MTAPVTAPTRISLRPRATSRLPAATAFMAFVVFALRLRNDNYLEGLGK